MVAMNQNEESPLIADSPADPQMESSPHQQGRKTRALLVLCLIVLLAVAGHSTLNISPMTASLFRGTKTHYQSIADKAAQKHLVEPALISETYYNTTTEEREEYGMYLPIMGQSLMKGGKLPALPPPLGCQATIVIVRHCEKGRVREHCSEDGFERAKYIASLFGDSPTNKWPTPSYLFALNPGERKNKHVHNMREVETIQPLSDKTGLKIDSSYGMKTKKLFAHHIFHLLRSGELCGKVVVICWKHQDIPHFARSIGCGPLDGCPKTWPGGNEFDETWQISYSYYKAPYPSFAAEKKKNIHKVWGAHPQWWISGHTENEDFDPLHFMKSVGTYPTNNPVGNNSP
eukprot:CAMPEP_0197242834 /NCGR_PEP_ID=MMETSP1429-20130617/8461_1 /TAXON_ID=49237 /ORGANISM="Chaetoceros  sp., Strain UNC1202" /LENGTH=344 /DNA_ID=CAMNT_0042702935 /DNA_START=243 /DNA_END=1277 /DNA_ORIENTATION=-